tara:strand:- start:2093 stop:2563 length:471 start_codon:yes stop_codon:yes gene_type:complete
MGNKYQVVTVTATTDAETIGDNKVICQSIEIPISSECKIQSVTVLDETTTGPAIDVIFTTDSSNITQDEGKAVGEDVSALDDILAGVVGHVSLVAGDYTNLADGSVATKSNINLVVMGAENTSGKKLYMHIVNRSGANWVATATDNMRVKVGLERV